MISPRKTGAFISRLRKERDLTQLQLAARLNVTHQAVSRWETGEAFPDIGILPVLARAFDVTVDDLLNGEEAERQPSTEPAAASLPVTAGSVIKELAQGNVGAVARMVHDDPQGFQAVIDAAPLTPPSLMKGVFSQMQNTPLTLEQIEALAPFLDQDLLLDLINASGAELNSEAIDALAPFLSHESIDQIATRIFNGELNPSHLTSLGPFLSKETLERLVDQVGGDGVIGDQQILELAPFFSKAAISRLMDRFEAGQLSFELVTEIAPFVDQARLDDLVINQAGTKVPVDEIGSLAPFVSKKAVAQLLSRALDGTLPTDLLSDLGPFIDRQALNDLIRSQIKKPAADE